MFISAHNCLEPATAPQTPHLGSGSIYVTTQMKATGLGPRVKFLE